MKHQTRKLAFTSFVLAAMLLLCALFPLIPIKKSASAQNDPIDSDHYVAYITQDERSAVPDNFLVQNYRHYRKIILPLVDYDVVEATFDNCLNQSYDLIILDFQYSLYDEQLMYKWLNPFEESAIPIVLIHSYGASAIETMSYFPFLTAAISVNEWANGEFGYLLPRMAKSISYRYDSGTTVTIIIDHAFYYEYFLIGENEGINELVNLIINALYGKNIYDYRLILQMGNGVATDDFLIIEPTNTSFESEYTESMKTFTCGSEICAEYPGEQFCGMTTIPFSFTYDYFKEIYESGYREFNAYLFVSCLSLHFGGIPPFPYEIDGTDVIITPDDIDNAVAGDDTVPQWLEDKRKAFGEYLLSIINKIFDGESIEEKSSYFIYII